ncbi:hypothetical protein ACLOJK_034753 [Asimina triloba]
MARGALYCRMVDFRAGVITAIEIYHGQIGAGRLLCSDCWMDLEAVMVGIADLLLISNTMTTGVHGDDDGATV